MTQKCLSLAPAVVLYTGLLFQTNSVARGPVKHSGSKVSFAAVNKLLFRECTPCHSASNHAGGADLSSYQAIMKGGEKGKLVVPGKPLKSDLLLYVDGAKKPAMPLRKPALSKAEVSVISDWIKSGAKSK